LDEGEVVRLKLVVARCAPAAVLDLVEEPLDQVPGAVQILAEANKLFAIRPWWDVGPCAPIGGKRSDPVCILASVGQHHCFRLQARE